MNKGAFDSMKKKEKIISVILDSNRPLKTNEIANKVGESIYSTYSQLKRLYRLNIVDRTPTLRGRAVVWSIHDTIR